MFQDQYRPCFGNKFDSVVGTQEKISQFKEFLWKYTKKSVMWGKE
jgi:hypothetical protein